MSPTDKSPHELFLEAAAVETLALLLGGVAGDWPRKAPGASDFWRSEARRLITENMETRHDG